MKADKAIYNVESNCAWPFNDKSSHFNGFLKLYFLNEFPGFIKKADI